MPRFERSQIGALPCASFGDGPPVLVIAGLMPTTGVRGDLLLRGTVAPFEVLAPTHRVIVVDRRLVLASTGCRLEGTTKELQRRVAARIRAGAPRRAMAVMAADLVPPWRGRPVAAVAALLAGP